ncbi:MAG: A/G-specific DNA glycosylase [Parcubacteria group bacterium Gr01-1014_66]|nr:MAG: A/G-specific DNA glycosylase [Parcubacteria group bacterium Gr01-1014_66]
MRASSLKNFQKTVWAYYYAHKRSFPWRATRDPYRILISEIMLQQTQVERVLQKYDMFLARFPDFESLADATQKEILGIWQGLGYNRRALFLHSLAQIVREQHGGVLPSDPDLLDALPGIGRATAGAVAAFAFLVPVPFIETNIRRVFLHFFFPRILRVEDKKILLCVDATLDRENPREWYYALMDYGAMLGNKEKINPNRRWAQYCIQSRFAGSDREIRGKIIRLLIAAPGLSREMLSHLLAEPPARIRRIITALKKEGFLSNETRDIRLA